MLGQKAAGVAGEQPGSEGEEEGSEDHSEDAKPIEEEDKGEDSIPENERIKMNLKNSSKIYYSITHTV